MQSLQRRDRIALEIIEGAVDTVPILGLVYPQIHISDQELPSLPACQGARLARNENAGQPHGRDLAPYGQNKWCPLQATLPMGEYALTILENTKFWPRCLTPHLEIEC